MFDNDVPSHTEQFFRLHAGGRRCKVHLCNLRKINLKVVMFESSKFDKSGLKSGGHIRPGPDLAGFEKTAGFRPGPGPDMISGATLVIIVIIIIIIIIFQCVCLPES